MGTPLTANENKHVVSLIKSSDLEQYLSSSLQADFVNTPLLYRDQATRLERLLVCPYGLRQRVAHTILFEIVKVFHLYILTTRKGFFEKKHSCGFIF